MVVFFISCVSLRQVANIMANIIMQDLIDLNGEWILILINGDQKSSINSHADNIRGLSINPY